MHPLREARLAAGLTLRDIGERLGVDPRLIQQWEVGTRDPTPGSLLRLARALKVDAEELLVRCAHLPDRALRRLRDDPTPILAAIRCAPNLEEARRLVNGWAEPRITPERRELEAVLDPGGRADEPAGPVSGRNKRRARQTVKRSACQRRSTSPLRATRDAAGLTLQALGERLGVDRQLVHQWETGTRVPRPETVLRIARALDVDVDELLARHGHVPDWARTILKTHPRPALHALEIADDLSRVRALLETWPYAGRTSTIDRLRELLDPPGSHRRP